jgi:hypothetical protein
MEVLSGCRSRTTRAAQQSALRRPVHSRDHHSGGSPLVEDEAGVHRRDANSLLGVYNSIATASDLALSTAWACWQARGRSTTYRSNLRLPDTQRQRTGRSCLLAAEQFGDCSCQTSGKNLKTPTSPHAHRNRPPSPGASKGDAAGPLGNALLHVHGVLAERRAANTVGACRAGITSLGRSTASCRCTASTHAPR